MAGRTRRGRWCTVAVAFVVGATAVGCGSDDGAEDDTGMPAQLRAAVEAVEDELGEGQEYFEVTATPALVNVFVAVDGATAAVPYVYRNGELLPPAPTMTGVSGFTFTADAIAFDDDAVLSLVTEELPDTFVETLSVEGGEGDVVRYVVTARSDAGGALEITVGDDGSVLAVDPL